MGSGGGSGESARELYAWSSLGGEKANTESFSGVMGRSMTSKGLEVVDSSSTGLRDGLGSKSRSGCLATKLENVSQSQGGNGFSAL